MKTTLKKILCFMLAFSMAISMLSVQALAISSEDVTETVDAENSLETGTLDSEAENASDSDTDTAPIDDSASEESTVNNEEPVSIEDSTSVSEEIPVASAEDDVSKESVVDNENPVLSEDVLPDLGENRIDSASEAEEITTLAVSDYSRGQWLQELENTFNLTASADAYPDVYYPDIEDSTYFDIVMTAVLYGLSDVEPGDNFEPSAPLTRDFAAHTLNYLLGMEKIAENYTFSDSALTNYPDDAQAVVDIGWLLLVNGDFVPDQAVTETEAITMLTGAREILNSRNSDSAENNYVLADYVIQVPQSADVTVMGDLVQITGFDGIVSGDVFAVDYQGMPFVYTADYVDKQGDILVIDVSDAPEEAILSASFSGEITPELTFTPDEQIVTLADGDGNPIVFGAARTIEIGKDYIKVNRSITLADGVTGSLNAELTNVRIDTQNIGAQKGFVLTGNLDVSSTVKFDLLNDKAASNLTLGKLGLEPFGSISLSIELKMEGKLSYAYSGVLSIGAYIRNKELSTNVSFKNGQTTLSADGTTSAKLTLAGSLKIPVVCSAAIHASIGPVIKANAYKYSSGTPQSCITLSGYLEAKAYVEAKFIGREPYSRNFSLFTEKNSPIRVYEHVEDGKTVYACTRGAGSGGSSYTPPKYITPAGSKIYSSGNSSGSSSWTGSGGGSVVIWTTEPNQNGGVTVTGYKGSASVLNIPETIDGETVTAIGRQAFQNNTNIRIVNMPDTVASIGEFAFRNCTNLQTVSFSENLTEIGGCAFEDCTALTQADLPDGLTTIGYGTFSGCTALKTAYIPSTLETVSYGGWDGVFEECSSLDTIIFGVGITQIPDNLFKKCPGLTHIEIPDTVTSIGEFAFRGCTNLQTVSFSENLTEIGGCAFEDCTALTQADLPDGLTTIGYGTFSGCTALKTAYIPSTLETVSYGGWDGVFEECSSLDTIIFGVGITQIPDNLFKKCPGLTHIEIPDTVTSIGEFAFRGCTNLQTVSFSENLTEIGGCAFEDCTALTQADLPDGLTTIGYGTFSGCTALKTAYIPSTLETVSYGGWDGVFEECSSLDTIIFGVGITQIPDNLFKKCPGLTHIEIPGTVTSIGANAFSNCTNLATIQIPDSVITVGSSAFCNSGLVTITIPDTVSEYPNTIFQNCTKLTTATLSKTALVIPQSMFSGCTSLKTVNLPDGVAEIKYNTFQNCTALIDLSFLPYTVTTIGDSAFLGCTGLVSAELPDLVSSLGNSVFKGCTNLTSFKASNDLLTIGGYCFQDCAKLTDVDLNDGLTTIGAYAFQNCAALQKIVLPNSVTSIGAYIFQKDIKLTDVTLSDGLTEIPTCAFANCNNSAFTNLVIPNGVKTIRANAFYQDTGLKNFTIPASVTSIESNAFSYPTTTAVSGIAGSYAQTYAKWKSFTDITKPAANITLANGTSAMTIGRGLTVTPKFVFMPSDSVDAVLTLVSDNTNVVSVRNDTQLYGNWMGSANITATTCSGLTYTFTVTVDTMSGIEITHLPDITDFGLKDDKDVTGLIVSAVFSNGSREVVYDYTLSGFTTDISGTHIVTATYNWQTATFPITVSNIESGTLGNNSELRWTYSSGFGQVTLTGPVSASEPVYTAIYDKDGKLIKVIAVTISGEKANIGNNFDHVKLIWADTNGAPKCANAELKLLAP